MTAKDTHFRGSAGLPPDAAAPEIVGLALPAEHQCQTLRWREAWQRGIRLPSELAFALLCSLVWAALYNASFWHQAVAAMWHPAPSAVLFFVSLLLVILSLQAIPLLLMPEPRWMKAAASLLFLIAAPSSYFIATYSAVMNKDMMRNVLQTDRAEVHGLVNGDLLLHIVVFGAVPAILVWCVRFPQLPWRRRARRQILAITGALLLSLGAIFACSANYAVFFREHKPVRFTVSPLAPVASLLQLASDHRRRVDDAPLMNPEGKAQRIGAAHSRPLVVFLVIGETARAANFQLGGYERPTTPRLASTPGLVYFEHTAACGTSTAISVPCLFSPLGREDFVVEDANASTNLLDSLTDAGFDVEWRDNNAGCKGVCERVRTVTYESPAGATDCPGGHCYD